MRSSPSFSVVIARLSRYVRSLAVCVNLSSSTFRRGFGVIGIFFGGEKTNCADGSTSPRKFQQRILASEKCIAIIIDVMIKMTYWSKNQTWAWSVNCRLIH